MYSSFFFCRSVESAKASRGGLPEKIWMKVSLSLPWFHQLFPSLLAVCSVLLSKLSRMQLLSLFLAFYDCFNLQQQFAIGVNDVTRVLERMPHSGTASHSTQRSSEAPTVSGRLQAPLVPLQVNFSFLVCCWCTSIGSLQWNCISISIVCIYEVEGSGFLVAAFYWINCTILYHFVFIKEKDIK